MEEVRKAVLKSKFDKATKLQEIKNGFGEVVTPPYIRTCLSIIASQESVKINTRLDNGKLVFVKGVK